MKTRLWKIQNKVIAFPIKWGKNEVVSFVNTNIRVCPYCNQIDASLDHLNECYKDPQLYQPQSYEL